MPKANLLTGLILGALVIGALIGEFFLFDPGIDPDVLAAQTNGWKLAGDFVFIRPLNLLIIPFVFTSVIIGITSVGDPKRLGLLGSATVAYYILTMILAVATGVTLAVLIHPGTGIPEDLRLNAINSGADIAASKGPSGSAGQGLGTAWINILRLLIPDNFFGAASAGKALSVITASIALGAGLVAIGEKNKPFLEMIESLHEALLTLVRWMLWVMPIGVLFLIAWAVGNIGIEQLFRSLGSYVVTVMLGLGIHGFITLPIVLFLLARCNPFKFMWSMRPALLTAFSSASSMATLPVTIETASESAGCSKRSAGLVLPLGATVNMDGTALYQGIAVIFLFQAYGIDLSFTQYLMIVLTATLSAVGAAGVPGGSIATTLIIIAAVNQTLSGTGNAETLPLAAIGLILGVDRILDMCRTAVNVWGDSVGARIISRLAPDDAEDREEAFA